MEQIQLDRFPQGPEKSLNHHRLKPVDSKATESRAQAESQITMTESLFRLKPASCDRLKVRLQDYSSSYVSAIVKFFSSSLPWFST